MIPTDTRPNNDTIITSSLRPNDVGDVVWTQWRRYYCIVCPLGCHHRPDFSPILAYYGLNKQCWINSLQIKRVKCHVNVSWSFWECWGRYLVVTRTNCEMEVFTLRPGENGWYLADDILQKYFSKEERCVLIQISLNVVLGVPIDTMSVLVQVMAYHLAWWHHQMKKNPRYWPFVRGNQFTGHRWISPTKVSDAVLWSFLWSTPE